MLPESPVFLQIPQLKEKVSLVHTLKIVSFVFFVIVNHYSEFLIVNFRLITVTNLMTAGENLFN